MRVRLLFSAGLPQGLAARLLSRLTEPFEGLEAAPAETDPLVFLDRHRRQVDAAALLQEIAVPPAGETVLLLVSQDLFVSVMTYVFGLSELGARRGVLSLARLAEGGLAALERRALTESIHELGHSIGLVHCPVADCAMHRTLWPEQVELKRPELCPGCLELARACL